MARAIVIPLDPAASPDEVAELLDRLGELLPYETQQHAIGLGPIVVESYVPPAEQRIRLVDSDGSRLGVDPPPLSAELADTIHWIRGNTEAVGLDRFDLDSHPPFRDHGEEIARVRSIELLRLGSSPIAGRPGWRRTPDGREWYSAAWLELVS